MEKNLEKKNWWVVPTVKPSEHQQLFVDNCRGFLFRGLAAGDRANEVRMGKYDMMFGWPDASRCINNQNTDIKFFPARLDTFYNLEINPYQPEKRTISKQDLRKIIGYGRGDFDTYIQKFRRFTWVSWVEFREKKNEV